MRPERWVFRMLRSMRTAASSGRRLLPMVCAGLVWVTACTSAGPRAGAGPSPSDSPTASATRRAAAPGAVDASRRALAARAYEQLLLADRPVALWPLDGALDQHARRALALPSAANDGQPSGQEPGAVAGPVLEGGPRGASAFSGAGRFVTSLRVGGAAMPTWSVEFWLRRGECGTAFERVAGNSVRGAAGREGIDIFAYPRKANSPCVVGAELWGRGTFLGGCAQRNRTPLDEWHHFAITRSSTTTSCYVDGVFENARTGPSAPVAPAAGWGVGGSGTGYGAGLRGSLTDLAVYDRVVPAATLLRHARAAFPPRASANKVRDTPPP